MKKIVLLFTLICTIFSLSAQDFLQGADRFSSKKDSYIYLKDGTEVIGTIKDIDRKKGLIKKIELKVDGKKVKFMPEEIDHMYLIPSGFDKFVRGYDGLFDLTELEKDRSLNEGLIKEGYVLFQTVDVKIKKKSKTLLMQLINPGYNTKVAVYHDPYASESAGLGIGRMKVAGGDKKSYYIKAGDEEAFKLKKKDYKKKWKEIFKDCKDIDKAFNGKMNWTKFSEHVLHYTSKCK